SVFDRQDTNGLAAGTNACEAACAALFEVLERDALAKMSYDSVVRVGPDGISPAMTELYARFQHEQVDLALFLCPNPFDIPAFYAISRDDHFPWPQFFCYGAGTHLDPETAALRAMTEVAQSRATFLAGVREDISGKVARAGRSPYEDRARAIERW